jgi:hypothetical protein
MRQPEMSETAVATMGRRTVVPQARRAERRFAERSSRKLIIVAHLLAVVPGSRAPVVDDGQHGAPSRGGASE